MIRTNEAHESEYSMLSSVLYCIISAYTKAVSSASSGSINRAHVGGSPRPSVGLASDILDHGHPRGSFDNALLPVQGDLQEGAKSSVPSSEEKGLQSKPLSNAVNPAL